MWRLVEGNGESCHNQSSSPPLCSAVGLVRVEKLTRAFLGSAGEDAAAVEFFNEGLGKAGNQSEASAASRTGEWLG